MDAVMDNPSRALLLKMGSLQGAMRMIVECGKEEHVAAMVRLVDGLLDTARSMIDQQHQLHDHHHHHHHQQHLQPLNQPPRDLHQSNLPKAEEVPWLEDHLYQQAMAMVKQEDVVNHGSTTLEVDAGDHSSDGGSYDVIQMEAMEILAEHTHFCEICGKGFKRDANLRMHMRGHGDEYKSPAALARPEATVVTAPPARRKRYSCPYVGCKRNREHKKFVPLKTILCVKNHYRRSHCPKKLTCTRCGVKKFAVLADLKTHEKHCGREKWQCSCGTTFSRKDKLLGHVALFLGHSPLSMHAPLSLHSPGTTPIFIPSSSYVFDQVEQGKSSSSSASSSSGSHKNVPLNPPDPRNPTNLMNPNPEMNSNPQNLQGHLDLQQLQELHQQLLMSNFASPEDLVVVTEDDDEKWSLFPIGEDNAQPPSFGFLGLDFLDCKT